MAYLFILSMNILTELQRNFLVMVTPEVYVDLIRPYVNIIEQGNLSWNYSFLELCLLTPIYRRYSQVRGKC